MLNTINQYIKKLPDTNFNKYFMEYVMDIQDVNIEREFKHTVSRNLLDIVSTENLIYNELKSIVI